MDRRRFLLTSVVGALAAPVAAEAQEPASRTRVAFVGAETPSTNQQQDLPLGKAADRGSAAFFLRVRSAEPRSRQAVEV
jgi:hypothetical protein